MGSHHWPPVACPAPSLPLASDGIQNKHTPQKVLPCSRPPPCPEWGQELPLALPSQPPQKPLPLHSSIQRSSVMLQPSALPGSCSQSQRVGIRMLEEPRTQTGLSLFSTAPLQTVHPSLSTSQRLRARALELRACQGEGLECSVNEARARSANELVQR